MMMLPVSPYFICTPINTRLASASTVAVTTVSEGFHVRLARRAFDFRPFERLLFVGERAELEDLAVSEREDVRYSPFAPFHFVFQPHAHLDERDDLVAGDDEPLGLASAFGPSRARLRIASAPPRCRDRSRLGENQAAQRAQSAGRVS